MELLAGAVERRLMADVPLGTFLSGGIDSSTVVALLTRFLPAREIKTFSIGFDEPSFDESLYSEQVARHFGTDHYTRRFTAQDLLARVARHDGRAAGVRAIGVRAGQKLLQVHLTERERRQV